MKSILVVLSAFSLLGCEGAPLRCPASSVSNSCTETGLADKRQEKEISPAVLEGDLRRILGQLSPESAQPLDLYAYEKSPVKVQLTPDLIKKSLSEPVPVNDQFCLFRGNLYESSYFRKTVFSQTGQEILNDPNTVLTRHPYLSINDQGHLEWHENGASQTLMKSLAELNPKKIRLYRGTSRMEFAIFSYLRDLVTQGSLDSRWSNRDAKRFEDVLKKIANDPVNKPLRSYFPRWKKFLAKQLKRKPSNSDFVFASLDMFTPQLRGTFTTPDLVGASNFAFRNTLPGVAPLPQGAVLIFEIDPSQLSPVVLDGIYAGIESEVGDYIEIAFMGREAKLLMLKSLSQQVFNQPAAAPKTQ